jgi:hypothetical protein
LAPENRRSGIYDDIIFDGGMTVDDINDTFFGWDRLIVNVGIALLIAAALNNVFRNLWQSGFDRRQRPRVYFAGIVFFYAIGHRVVLFTTKKAELHTLCF